MHIEMHFIALKEHFYQVRQSTHLLTRWNFLLLVLNIDKY